MATMKVFYRIGQQIHNSLEDIMRVKVGQVLICHPNLLDGLFPVAQAQSGDAVRVINLHGAPKANTMGHCYIETIDTHKFIGLVHTNSLHTKAEYAAYLRAKIAEHEKRTPVLSTRHSVHP